MAYNPTPTEKAGALFDVAYEIEQVPGLLKDSPTPDKITCNARLEALLLHTRVLLDFFEHSKREHDDVLATDYDFPAKPLALNPEIQNRLNKELAHLTYSRQQRKGPAKRWYPRDLKPLLQRSLEFAEHVVATRLDSLPPNQRQWWRELVAILRQYTA